jgi:hypothetical protein
MPLRLPSQSPPLRTGSARTIFVLVLWAAVLAVGFRNLVQYEVTAGPAGETPKEWPAGTPVKFDATKSNLVMFAHPKCPCTRASLAELTRVLTQARGAIKASILFDVPRGESGWEEGKLWQTATAIPGVEVATDPDGTWAKRFGAETSGYVVLFDSSGHLVFRGGITGARGHEGENAGQEAVVNLALARNGSSDSTAVFGCPLSEPTPELEQHP